ncbi:hypothetical protein [Streptomyces sp. GbtcB7]|uniref:hypothetical protein n=1 Tax=Streptomyces sp. GbtcB7 TaxID=2824752 RepID=UPI001C30E3D8|nr:hypothetical protein [Streptomyces sp. GbtcB7]
MSVAPAVVPRLDVLNVPREAERQLGLVTDPRRRAILINFRRHAMLEVSGRWPEILDPGLTVAHPVYRIAEGDRTTVFDGRDAVAGFYRTITDAGLNLLGPLTERIAVADWGLAIESLLGQIVPGALMEPVMGEDVGDLDAHYLVTHKVANIWPYDDDGRLLGEHVYIDRASREIHRMDPADVITPKRAAELLAPLLNAPIDVGVTPA